MENLLTLPITAQEILEEYKKNQQILKVVISLKNGEKLSKVNTWKFNVEDFCLKQGLLGRGYRVVIPPEFTR